MTYYLVGLVPFPGKQDYRSFRGCHHCRPYGVLPVGYRYGLPEAFSAEACHDFVYDCLGVFRPRVVGRDENPVGVFFSNGSHFGAFAPVPVSSAAENGDYAVASPCLPEGLQYVFKGVRSVCVVDYYRKAVLSPEVFHPSCHRCQPADALQRLFSVETRYTAKEYAELLSWFHFRSYLFCSENEELTDTVKSFMRQNPQLQPNIMAFHDVMAHVSRHSFLAYTSPYWLSRLIPADHPDYEMFREEAEKAESFKDPALAANSETYEKQYEKFREVAGDDLLIYMTKKSDFKAFMKEHLDMDLEDDEGKDEENFAVYATPEEGIRVLTGGVQFIKDPKNPFYDEKKAVSQALGFFIVKHCSTGLLKELMSRGMLADAQTKSLDTPERGKSIIQDNWKFLCMYFLKEDPDKMK